MSERRDSLMKSQSAPRYLITKGVRISIQKACGAFLSKPTEHRRDELIVAIGATDGLVISEPENARFEALVAKMEQDDEARQPPKTDPQVATDPKPDPDGASGPEQPELPSTEEPAG